jgi:hypothetical protein
MSLHIRTRLTVMRNNCRGMLTRLTVTCISKLNVAGHTLCKHPCRLSNQKSRHAEVGELCFIQHIKLQPPLARNTIRVHYSVYGNYLHLLRVIRNRQARPVEKSRASQLLQQVVHSVTIRLLKIRDPESVIWNSHSETG